MDFGLVVDVETTGLDPTKDRIIEIGIVEFAALSGEPPRLTRTYGALADPGLPLTPEIERITGLTDKMLAGQSIDWDFVRSLFAKAALVIAHNMDFDRRFLESSGQLLGLKPHWACSMRHIDWRSRNFSSLSLNYLAADHGFLNPFAHRAVFDCATTFRLIAPHLQELTERSYEREYMVKAVGSPFETKDLLRMRGYKWDPDERCWSRVVGETALPVERQFLAEQIYRGRAGHLEQELG